MKKSIILRKTFLFLLDAFFVLFSTVFAAYAVYGPDGVNPFLINSFYLILAMLVVKLVIFKLFRFYNFLWQYTGVDEAMLLSLGMIVTFVIEALTIKFLQWNYSFVYPLRIAIITFVFSTIFIMFSRVSYRVIRRLMVSYYVHIKRDERKRVLIVGAGGTGEKLIKEMFLELSDSMLPVGLVDDDLTKQHQRLHGVYIYGGREDIPELAKKLKVDIIIIATPSATSFEINKIAEIASSTKCKVKIMPNYFDLEGKEVSLKQAKDIDILDILGRDEISLDKKNISGFIKDKTIIVTGGGGSIGSELCRQIIKYSPKLLIIFDIYENNAYDLQQELIRKYGKDVQIEVLIGSVRDVPRLEYVFEKYKPEVVFHAAAHKHVPLMEDSPHEAIKNNVFGTQNVALTADKYGVKKFVLISTDKAVNPANVMGATKRVAELTIQSINRRSQTNFVAVRFGNVLGSNGSVVPLFKKQIADGGPVTVTHPDITRYFMTIPEAAQLVLQAGAMASGGEIFVLDMGKPMYITDLARKMIRLAGYEPDRDIKIEFTGLRPGEKLYEELLLSEEGVDTTSYKKIFVEKPTTVDIDKVEPTIAELREIINTKIDYFAYLENLIKKPIKNNEGKFYSADNNAVKVEV